ncbi:MAG: DUF402 domain-containing protein [Chloroflexota bacterium]
MATEDTRPLFTVHKLDLDGHEVIAYQGWLVARDDQRIILDARWQWETRDYGYATFEPGDRFLEYYYPQRWYTVFEVRAAQDDTLKGWYCNITRPAQIEAQDIRSVDLALDLWVYPDRRVVVLDEDEFQALALTPAERRAAESALAELLTLAAVGALPPR